MDANRGGHHEEGADGLSLSKPRSLLTEQLKRCPPKQGPPFVHLDPTLAGRPTHHQKTDRPPDGGPESARKTGGSPPINIPTHW